MRAEETLMTLIVTVNTPEISLMLGDARLTAMDQHGTATYDDCCQKVYRLSESTVLGFAGDLLVAADFLNTLTALYHPLGENTFNERFSIQELILRTVPQIKQFGDSFRYPDGTLHPSDFVFTGRARPNVPVFQTLHLRFPDGHFELLTQEGITVLGSGREFFEPIAKMLAGCLPHYREVAADHPDPPHYLAWQIQSFICSMLLNQRSARPQSFGTILHGMYVDQHRITSLECTLESPCEFLGVPIKASFGGGYHVTFENNRFCLRTADGRKAVLMTPAEVIAGQHTGGSQRIDP